MEKVNGPLAGTNYFSTLDEAIEHVRAAATLGLGFLLANQWQATGEDSAELEYVFSLYAEPPTVGDPDEEDDGDSGQDAGDDALG